MRNFDCHSDGVGGLLNYHNVSYSGQPFCFTKELGTALLEWQLERAIVLRFNARVSNIAWSIASDCSLEQPAIDGHRYDCSRHLIYDSVIAKAFPCAHYQIDKNMIEKEVVIDDNAYAGKSSSDEQSIGLALGDVTINIGISSKKK